MMNRTSSGVERKRMLLTMAFTLTDLPAPVDPAISRCGIVARSVTKGSPVSRSLPSKPFPGVIS